MTFWNVTLIFGGESHFLRYKGCAGLGMGIILCGRRMLYFMEYRGEHGMTKFIENINAYLSQMKIKQTYVSLKTGIDVKKLSRILTGAQDVSGTDMEKIANALGHKVEYFLSDAFYVPKINELVPEKIAFYAGNPTVKQDEIAEKLEKLMGNIDEVMSAKYRFINISR